MSSTSFEPTGQDGPDPVPTPADGSRSESPAPASPPEGAQLPKAKAADPASPSEGAASQSDGPAFTGLQTLRPGSSIAVGIAALVAGLALVVPALTSSYRSWPLISGVVLALVLVWLSVVRPHVKLHDEGVRIVNPLRTIDLTWPMITGVRSRWTLELLSGSEKFTAWGVPADSRRPRYGRGLLTLGASKTLRAQQAEAAAASRPKVEARTVAAEIEARLVRDRDAVDRRTPRLVQRVWDPAPIALLLAALAFFAAAMLL